MKTQDNRERFTLRLSKSIYDQLTIRAKEYGVSMNAMISHILHEWAQEQDKQPA